VFRRLGLLAALAGAVVLAPWAAAQSQSFPDAQAGTSAKPAPQAQAAAQPQEQSLADAARQARQNKDKNTAPAKRVFTDEDVAAASHGDSSSSSVSSLTSPRSNSASSHAGPHSSRANNDTPMGQAWAGIDRAENSLDQLAPLDRASLGHVVLEGNDVDFPGRRAWEDRLYVAKETYVTESRQLVDEMKSVMENAQSFQSSDGAAKGSAESPQAQELIGRAQRLLLQAKTTEANFKSVMQEGIDQAKAAKH
jgi:hypothetical protein